jgi:hypothetical protein
MHVTPAYDSSIQFLYTTVRACRELTTQMLVKERVMPDTYKPEREKVTGRRPRRVFIFAVLAEPF